MMLTVLSRTYCHLCDDLIAALQAVQRRVSGVCPFEIRVVDVDQHADLEMRYGDKVPVLLDGDFEICHHFMNENELMARLRSTAAN